MKTVSVYSFSEKDLDRIVINGFKEIGLDKALLTAKQVFIKPNLVTDVAEYIKNGANTDIRIIAAVLKYLSKYRIKILLGESDSGTKVKGRKLESALRLMGVYDLKNKYNFEIINLTKDSQIIVDIPKARILKKISMGKTLMESDIIINLPKIKTHKYATITCGLKNMFGTIPDPIRIVYHENIHLTLSELNKLFHHKTYVLTDGIIAMEGNGPIYGEGVDLNTLIFSNSMYCNDVVACKIMQQNPQEVGHLRLISEYLLESDKSHTLIENVKLNQISRKFRPSTKNLYMKLEGKLMQYRWTVKLFHNEWVQRNITYRLRSILKFFRGGSSSWYVRK